MKITSLYGAHADGAKLSERKNYRKILVNAFDLFARKSVTIA
jgi:hypothetical protein